MVLWNQFWQSVGHSVNNSISRLNFLEIANEVRGFLKVRNCQNQSLNKKFNFWEKVLEYSKIRIFWFFKKFYQLMCTFFFLNMTNHDVLFQSVWNWISQFTLHQQIVYSSFNLNISYRLPYQRLIWNNKKADSYLKNLWFSKLGETVWLLFFI